MSSVIHQEDLIESIASAFQYISYYHTPDFLKHMAAAYQREESAAAKDAIGQIFKIHVFAKLASALFAKILV